MITENYRYVRGRIDEACRRAGRNPQDVTLIAVSKTKPVSMIEELLPEEAHWIRIEKDLDQGFDYRRITWDGIGEEA